VPILKQGMRLAFASLKMVIRDTANNWASSAAVSARENLSIRSGKEYVTSDMEQLRDE
jgi:hypothetical protein